MTTTAIDLNTLEAILAEAASALEATTSPVTLAENLPEDLVLFRSAIAGADGIVTAMPAAALESGEITAESLVDPLVASFTQTLSATGGEQLAAARAEAVDEVGEGTVVSFELGGSDGDSLALHWVLEPGLVSLLSGGPVTPLEEAAPARASFPELEGSSDAGPIQDLALLAEVPMEVTVELGRTKLRVRELLSLHEGSVIELDRAADTTVAVYVNGTLIARGDVVVVDDELGVRITEVIARP